MTEHSTHYRNTWERYHGIKIPKGWEVHHWKPQSEGGTHIINNLVACPKKAHNKFHDGRLTNWMDSLRKFGGTGKSVLTGEDRTVSQKAADINKTGESHHWYGSRGLDCVKSDKRMYWFIHKLYGLVKTTRINLSKSYESAKHIEKLFYNNPRLTTGGWSLHQKENNNGTR